MYIKLLQDFSLKDQTGKVCHLKQCPHAWFDPFSQAKLKIEYKKCHANCTLFVKRQVTILIVYDIVVTDNGMVEVEDKETSRCKIWDQGS